MAGCPQCGEELPARGRFCPACGTPVGSAADPERIKLVTILFADVVGSTAQAERMSPDDTRALMADFFQAMSEEVIAEGGTVERLVGDALMVDFGVPVAHEDDPERAVRAARRMLDRLESWNAPRAEEEQIQVRIGINTGEVSTGGSLGEQLMVMGDAVNTAARLQQAAEPGSILVGERTARAVRRSFRLREGQQITAKGKSDPLHAFVVEGELEYPEEAAMLRAPIVGRTRELAMLRDAFERAARDGSPQFVTIVGDAGVGKSRLLQEFSATSTDRAKVLAGGCLPYGDGVTLAPLQEILRAEAGIFPQDAPDVSLKKVQKLIDDLPSIPAEDVRSMSAALTSTLGSTATLETLAGLDPRLVYREMVRAWRSLLGAASSEQPLVIAIEDLYWADQTMLDVLADLSEHLQGPILFLCTTRPEFVVAHSEWFARLRNHSTLRIEPLTRDSSESLVGALLGTGDLPEDLIDRVLVRAEGNPLFIEEILLRLIDEGHLVEVEGTWKVTVDLSEIEVPERVQTLIQARLDLLSPREREVVQAGAVLGRHFWSGALQHVTGFPDAQEIADALKPRQMIVEQLTSSIPGEIEYAFRHLLIRDVAYESLPRKARAEAHVAAAEWIESIRGGRAEEAAEVLADHYERAYEGLGRDDLRVHARRYFLMSAQGSLRRFAITQAEYFGQRAVAHSVSAQERIETLETLGDAFYLALRGTLAWEAYTAAIAELEEMEYPVTLARIAAKATWVPTRWVGTMDEEVAGAEVERLIFLGLQAAGDDDSRERAQLLSARAFLAGTSNLETARDVAEEASREAIAVAERLEDPDLLSAAIDASSVLLWPTGRYGEMVRIDRARVELIPKLSDGREVADILLSTGRDLTRVGHYVEALDYLDRAAATVKNIDPGQYLHVLVHRSSVLFFLARWDEALQDLVEIERLEVLSTEEAPPYAIRAFGIGYFCMELRGHLHDRDRYLRLLRSYKDSIDLLASGVLDPLALPARGLARAGRVEEAMTWLDLDRRWSRSEHLEAACDVVALSGRWDLAAQIEAEARREAEHAEVEALVCYADRLQGQILKRSGDLRASHDLLLGSAEGFAALGAKWEEALSRLWAARVLVEEHSAAQARVQLDKALPVFEFLHSAREEALCREVLKAL